MQRRSRETVERILAACEELLVEVGYEEAVRSPTLLLERAEVSKGAFYAYFLAPENAMAAVAINFLTEMMSTTDQLAATAHASWQEVVASTVQEWADYCRNPVVRELLLRSDLPVDADEANRAATEHVADQLLASIVRVAGTTTFSRQHALVAVELMDRLLRYAFRQNAGGDSDLIDEARVAMTAYIGVRMGAVVL